MPAGSQATHCRSRVSLFTSAQWCEARARRVKTAVNMLRAAVVLALSVGCLHAAAADSFNTQVRTQ